jgi:hypothetical protein
MNNNNFIHKHGRETCCRIIGRGWIRKCVGVIKYNLRAVEYGNRFGQNWDKFMSSAMLRDAVSAEGPKCKYGKVNCCHAVYELRDHCGTEPKCIHESSSDLD